MYKKIMVAISDDEISRNALEEALHIAAADDAKICIVHAVAKPGDNDESSDAAHQAVRVCWSRLNPPPLKH